MSDDQEARPAETPENPRSGQSTNPGTSGRSGGSPLIPPQWWLDRVNENRAPDLPYLTALDPLAMLLWHTVTRPPEGNMLLVTGC